MVLPPPLPPVFRHHHLHHPHPLRYDNVLHSPDFIPPPCTHHLPPPPPPPHPHRPHVLLPPPPPPRPPPPPMRHIAHPPFPPRLTFSPPHPPILERSHPYEFDPPPEPYFHRILLPPPPPPPPRQNIPFRVIHDHPERSPIFRDEFFHRGFVDNRMRELPENWDRDLQLGAKEHHARVPDIDIVDRDRYRDNFYQNHELFEKRDDGEGWDRGIGDWGGDLYNRRDYDERRWGSGMNDRDRGLYDLRDYVERRWGNDMNDQGCELYNERDYDERRWDNGIYDRGRELCERDYDERIRDSSRSNGVLFRLGNRQPEFVEDDLSLGRFTGRLGMEASKGEFNQSNKRRRLQKKDILRVKSGKDCSRHSGGYKRQHFPKGSSRGSLKGKQKGVERSKARMEDKREREKSPLELAISFKSNALVAKAILAPSRPVVKSDVKSISVDEDERFVYGKSDSPSAKSIKDVVLDLQSDSQKTSKDLLDEAAVSGGAIMTDKDASDLGEHALKNLKVKNLQEPTMVRSGRAHLNQLRKNRKARKQLLHKANLKMEMNNDDITNARDCIDRPPAVSQLNSDTKLLNGNLSSAFLGENPGSLPLLEGIISEKADVSGDSSRPFASKLKRKRSTLTTTSASSCVASNVISDCSGHEGRLVTASEDADHVLQLRADEVACHAHEKILANENMGHGDSLSFNPYMNNVGLFEHGRASGLDAEKGAIEYVGQCTRLGSNRVDDTDEHPVLGGSMLLESAFVKLPSKVTFSIEGRDIAGLSRPQETWIPEVHEDKHFLENHKLISTPKSDCAAMQTLQDVTISDVGSRDANPKDFSIDQVSVLQVGVDARGFRSSEGAAVADCSNFGLGISTSSGFLSADYEGILPKFDVSSPVAFKTRLSHNIDSMEGSSEVKSGGETCLSIDWSSNIVKKRKARVAQKGLSGTETNVCVGTARSIYGERARCLAEDLAPAVEGDLVAVKESCKEDDSLQGPPGDQDLIREFDIGINDSFLSYRKKQKLFSPRSSLSSLSEDDTIADMLTINSQIHDQQSISLTEQREDASSASTAIDQCGNVDMEGKAGFDNFYIVNLGDGNKPYGNDDLAPVANNISLCADRNGVYSSSSGDELLASGFDMQSCMSSPEELLAYSDLIFTGKTNESACLSENEMICGSDSISDKKLVSAVKNSQTNAHIPPSKLKDTSQVVKKLNPVYGKLTWSKNQLTPAVPKVFPGHLPLNFSNSRKLYPIHATKSRTWSRTGNSSVAVAEPKLQRCSVPQSHGTKSAGTTQSSYIRKGNSLVRNPSLSSVTPPGIHGSSCPGYKLTPCSTTMKISQISDCITADADADAPTEEVNTSEMTKAPTLNHSGKSISCNACNLWESFPVGNHSRNTCRCKTLDALEERIKSSPVRGNRTDSAINSDGQCTLEEGNSENKIMYVKRRSNQLIATSNSDDTSALGVDQNQASLSDGYYKSRQNQLVRASSKDHVKKGDANVNESMLLSQSTLPKTSTRRQSGFSKSRRYSKLSFVWKLHDTQSSEKDKNSLGSQKVWPHLFSSKRAAGWRSLRLGTKSNNSPFSTISQKLLLSGKRGAIYTRSIHGYSLRMLKVLSVGGSSLKWSKSMEKNSKRANEEATRAVAAAEKRKKEEKGSAPIASKSRNHVSRKLVLSVQLHPGERIFRFGSERYKMDPTRRTLHRITEKEPSSSVALQSENIKRSYIPRRLLIGNDEYVRIGNGNQLVRDPKKRTRVLASEKVRWSLRTARLRLARKRRYCQFFTRFGKCNKDDGKCLYIHDPSKIVVCTKFLTGSCTNPGCKLTHKVIPERMQDCSYFLKGSCSNENCPYRHVNVNPDSTVCESFLRGYCADGNECRKKHTYVCPAFEATGICPHASMCKLHHPKKKLEKKPTSEQKIVRGRYFDGGLIPVADSSEATTEKPSSKGKADIVYNDGNFPDYISLDVSDEDVDEPLDSGQGSGGILPD